MTCDIPNWAISIYYISALPFAFVSAYIILLVEHDESLKSDPSWLKWARFFGFLAVSCTLCLPYMYPEYLIWTMLLLIMFGCFVLLINMLSLHFRKKPHSIKQIAYFKVKSD
jgi:predicted membrane channel-forming protein YqfA (hemolysin III family)